MVEGWYWVIEKRRVVLGGFHEKRKGESILEMKGIDFVIVLMNKI